MVEGTREHSVSRHQRCRGADRCGGECPLLETGSAFLLSVGATTGLDMEALAPGHLCRAALSVADQGALIHEAGAL